MFEGYLAGTHPGTIRVAFSRSSSCEGQFPPHTLVHAGLNANKANPRIAGNKLLHTGSSTLKIHFPDSSGSPERTTRTQPGSQGAQNGRYLGGPFLTPGLQGRGGRLAALSGSGRKIPRYDARELSQGLQVGAIELQLLLPPTDHARGWQAVQVEGCTEGAALFLHILDVTSWPVLDKAIKDLQFKLQAYSRLNRAATVSLGE